MPEPIPSIPVSKLIEFITMSMNNSLQYSRSELFKKTEPETVKLMLEEAEAARRVIECLRHDKRPSTALGNVWFEWFVGWATIMSLYYNSESITPDETGTSQFTREVNKHRIYRDEQLAKLRQKT